MVDTHLIWFADDIRDEIELMNIVFAGKERPATQKFGEDAANRPYIDGFRVLLPRRT